MNKSELAAAVSERDGWTKRDGERAVEGVIDTIMEEVASGERVQIIGFGTFSKTHRSARKGTNPQTGETMDIPECTVPSFKPGKKFKGKVSGRN